jgi:hypothetical protein
VPAPDEIDLDQFRLTDDDTALVTVPAATSTSPSRRPPRPRHGEWFLRGPIPWSWIETATRLPGKALAVGLLVWREAQARHRTTVRITFAKAAKLGMHPDTARRALRSLEQAGLVCIAHWPGCGSDVTLLDAPKTEGAE